MQYTIKVETNWAKIKGGLYTARAKEGRYIATIAPFGYFKKSERKELRLFIEETEAKVMKFIYAAILCDVPLYIIRKKHMRNLI